MPTAVVINLADGTYSSVDTRNALCSIAGNLGGTSSTLTGIVGNCTTPTNVVLAIPANDVALFTKDGGEASIECVQITGGNNSVGLSAAQFSILDYTQIVWGAWGTNGVHVQVSQNASVNMIGPETITANIAVHWAVSSGASFLAEATTNIPSAVAWSTNFLLGYGNVNINLGAWSVSGSGIAGTTGKRATLQGPGFLLINGVPCNSFFPGNVACTLTQGFQDDGGDNGTSVYPSGGVSCPSGITADTVTIVNGIVTHC